MYHKGISKLSFTKLWVEKVLEILEEKKESGWIHLGIAFNRNWQNKISDYLFCCYIYMPVWMHLNTLELQGTWVDSMGLYYSWGNISPSLGLVLPLPSICNRNDLGRLFQSPPLTVFFIRITVSQTWIWVPVLLLTRLLHK